VSYFSDQINDQEKGRLFWPTIRKVRRAEIEESKRDFHWGEPDYKLYPSSVKSWTACPKKVILAHTVWGGISELDGIYRTRRGSAIHTEIQEDFQCSDRCAPLPDTSSMTERIKLKLFNNVPEVPFHDFDTGFSGSVDSVLQLRSGEIIPVEIKSTGLDEDQWAESIEKEFPRNMKAWTIQLCNYIYHLNKNKYYDRKITRGILAIINSRFDPANKEAYLEYVIDYSEYETRISELIEHLSLHRKAYINKQDLECSYPLCSEHNS
jgi:hypothetical protein